MSYSIGEYSYISSYHEGKKGYVNKFEKSVKMPFLSVLQTNLAHVKPPVSDEFGPTEDDFAISDNVELSSAITGATEANSSEARNMSDNGAA